MNPELARTLVSCRTCFPFMFPTHPVLRAVFDADCLVMPTQKWMLPRSFDAFQVDKQLAESTAKELLLTSRRKWEQAMSQNNIEELARIWTNTAELVLKNSAVNSSGEKCNISSAHLGRARKNPLRKVAQVVPLNRRARDGDYQSCLDQCSTKLRQHLKQLHRLQSLVRQYTSLTKMFSEKAFQQILHLWNMILCAKGFRRDFSRWVHEMLNISLGNYLPSLEIVILIKDTFMQWHHNNEQADLKAKQAIQKIELWEDWKNGGKIAFGKVKTTDLTPLTSIKNKVQCNIKRVAWPKEGKNYLPCENTNVLDLNLPVVFQTQVARISQVGQNGIFLDRNVHLLSYEPGTLVVEQEHTYASPEEMHAQLFAAWNVFFQRDNEEELDRVPEDMSDLIGRMPQSHVASLPPIDGAMIEHALRCTKVASSRGSDGFSTLDLRKLPISLLDMLALILQLIEQNGVWPQKWTLAKTLCLPKTADAKTPYDIRPVTVMAKIYRLWGHIRGKQVTSYISASIPPEIAGVCKKISSDMIALLIASKVEDAHRLNTPLGGMVVDLMKCYNTVPRGGLLLILSKLGVPIPVLNAFRAMMRQMNRFFEVAQCCSDPQLTTTGIIEGCGFAIPSMLAVSLLAHLAITEAAPDAQCAFFADNWSVFAHAFEDLQKSLDALHDVTRRLKMKIAPKKSWTWATSSTLRTQCASLQVDSIRIPLVHSAHDLGMQQNYTKKQSKKTVKSKIGKAKNRLQVIKNSKVPRGMKKTIAASVGHACVTYSGVFQQIAPQDLHALRSKTAAAIQCVGSGANSYLACNACDPSFDPEFKLLFLRLQMWKRFQRLFPDNAASLHQRCVEIQDVPSRLKKPGPVAALVNAVSQVGCKFGNVSGTLCVANRECHWMQVSAKALKQLLQRAWINHVVSTRISRKYFNLESFDWIGNKNAMAKLTYYHQSLISIYQTGRHITNDFLSKFLPGVQNRCVLCGNPDSREHRLFYCRNLDDVRPKKDTLQRVRNWGETCWHFALVPAIPDASEIIGSVTCHEVPWSLPPIGDAVHCVFTDGSAFFNNVPELSIASAAVLEVGQNSYTPNFAFGQLVPGVEQTSFAGELYSVLLALNRWYHVRIFSDCQTVVEMMEDEFFQQPRRHELKGPLLIWNCILRHLSQRGERQISILKVKAHVQIDKVSNPFERWAAWCNDFVDKKAKSTITADNRGLFLKLEAMHKRVSQHRTDAIALFEFIALASDKCIKASAKQQKERQKDNHF